MASYPDYNPSYFYNGISQAQFNEYNNSTTTPLRNRCIQNSYAPGSTFKMVTAVAALNEEKVDISERIYDSGTYWVEGMDRPYRCWLYTDYGYGHRDLNVIGAIEKSCNVYFYTVGSRTGINLIDKYASYFGLGHKTGVELTNETSGTLAAPDLVKKNEGRNWSEADTIIAAIGQSYNDFSPVQMAKYTSMLANGGYNIDLSIVKSVILSNGTQVSKQEINDFVKKKLNLPNDNVENIEIDPMYINAVQEGMRRVTDDEGGTASRIFDGFPIEVGGKTGSAEAGTDKYGNDITNAWFTGFAPFDDPEIAVVVMVENGGHGYYTAEVAKELIETYFGMNVASITEDMSAALEVESFR